MASITSDFVPAHGVEGREATLCDETRLEALARTGLMDSAAEPVFDRLTQLASRLLGVPVSLVSLVDDHRQFFKSACGLPEPRETPLSHSFCQHVVVNAEPLRVVDARTDRRVRDNLAIPDLGVIAYLGVPLLSPDGLPLGSFCAIDTKPRDWSEDDLLLLSDLAIAVQSEIISRLTLQEARELAAERDLLMDELNHRVKNLFAMVSGMIGMTARNSVDTADMAQRLRGRIAALADAHALVQPAITGRMESDGGADLAEIVRAILAPHARTGTITVDGPAFQLASESSARLSLVLHELATNAAKYGSLSQPGGSLSVAWSLGRDHLSLGWTERNPAVSASAPPPERTGFGTRLIEGAVRQQMQGTLTRNWMADGLSVSLVLPRRGIAQS